MIDNENVKILYVEDEKLARIMIERVISHKYKNIQTAEDGLAGLDKYKEIQPDIVITDLAMPRMTGFELIENIQKLNSSAKIIVTTAYREETAKISGAAILHKPIDKKKLYAVLDETIEELNKESN